MSIVKFKTLLLKINFFNAIPLLELTVHCASTFFLAILTDLKSKTTFKVQSLRKQNYWTLKSNWLAALQEGKRRMRFTSCPFLVLIRVSKVRLAQAFDPASRTFPIIIKQVCCFSNKHVLDRVA